MSAGTGEGDDICFVIGRPRSGTTVFRAMLESHPSVFGVGEVFNESNPASYFEFLKRRQKADTDALLPSRSVESFVAYVGERRADSRKRRPASRYAVLDVKYDQAHLLTVPWWGITYLPRLFSLIKERGWRAIDVHRQDGLAMFVSNHIALATGVYHSTGAANARAQKVHVDPDALMRHVTATTLGYKRVADHFRGYEKYLRVTYEEMFDSDGRFSGALRAHLGQFLDLEDAFDAGPRLRKILKDDPFSYIENADEIRDVLARNTAFSKP